MNDAIDALKQGDNPSANKDSSAGSNAGDKGQGNKRGGGHVAKKYKRRGGSRFPKDDAGGRPGNDHPRLQDVAWLANERSLAACDLGFPSQAGDILMPDRFKAASAVSGHILKAMVYPSSGLIASATAHDDIISPVEKAVANLYNKYRGSKVNTVPFEVNDLFCYLYAAGSFIATASWVKRRLESIRTVTPNSKLTPMVLPMALGLSEAGYKDARDNYADYIASLNTILAQSEALYIPSNLPFFKKCAWVCRSIYFEDQALWAGDYYMYDLKGVYCFTDHMRINQTGDQVASGLIALNVDAIDNIPDSLDLLQKLLDAMLFTDSCRQISGWLFSTLDQPSFFIDYLSDDAKMAGYFETDVKLQFCNMLAVGCPSGTLQTNTNFGQVAKKFVRPSGNDKYTPKIGDMYESGAANGMRVYGDYPLNRYQGGVAPTPTASSIASGDYIYACNGGVPVTSPTGLPLAREDVLVATEFTPSIVIDAYHKFYGTADSWLVSDYMTLSMVEDDGAVRLESSAWGNGQFQLMKYAKSKTTDGVITYEDVWMNLNPMLAYDWNYKPVLISYTAGTLNFDEHGEYSGDAVILAFYGDFSCYGMMSKHALKLAHENALYQEFGLYSQAEHTRVVK